MRDGKVGFAVVGCGVIAPFHTKAIDIGGKSTLVALCDIEKPKAEKLSAESGNVPVYTDYREMLDREADVDCVCVCTPSGIHWEVACAAAEAGRHVLSEKPLDITREHMDAMIESCRRAKVKLGCIFQRRTYRASKTVKRLLEEGRIGKLVLCDNHQKYYRSPAYYKSAGWRGTWEMDGGGALMNQGVHGIDLTIYLMGDVESVFAYAGHLVRDIEVEDTCVAVLRYANGAMGTLIGTTSVTPGRTCRHEIHGENGTIVLTDHGIEAVMVAKQRAGKAEPLDPSDYADPAEEPEAGDAAGDPKSISNYGHIVQIADMCEAVVQDREPMVSGEEARRSVDLILAIYESARTGKDVEVRRR